MGHSQSLLSVKTRSSMKDCDGMDSESPPSYASTVKGDLLRKGRNSKDASYIAFFCIQCGTHRITQFTCDQMSEYFNGIPIVSRLGGQPIGELVHCDQCLNVRCPDSILSRDLRQLVGSKSLDVVESALGDELLFLGVGFINSRQQGLQEHGVSSADGVYCDKSLFTGSVWRVDAITKRLVPADLETFFGFERRDAEEKRRREVSNAEIADVERLFGDRIHTGQQCSEYQRFLDNLKRLESTLKSIDL